LNHVDVLSVKRQRIFKRARELGEQHLAAASICINLEEQKSFSFFFFFSSFARQQAIVPFPLGHSGPQDGWRSSSAEKHPRISDMGRKRTKKLCYVVNGRDRLGIATYGRKEQHEQ
jgi:hypothetical protein